MGMNNTEAYHLIFGIEFLLNQNQHTKNIEVNTVDVIFTIENDNSILNCKFVLRSE